MAAPTTFGLADLPGVARRQGLPMTALLMERWFRDPARVLSPISGETAWIRGASRLRSSAMM